MHSRAIFEGPAEPSVPYPVALQTSKHNHKTCIFEDIAVSVPHFRPGSAYRLRREVGGQLGAPRTQVRGQLNRRWSQHFVRSRAPWDVSGAGGVDVMGQVRMLHTARDAVLSACEDTARPVAHPSPSQHSRTRSMYPCTPLFPARGPAGWQGPRVSAQPPAPGLRRHLGRQVRHADRSHVFSKAGGGGSSHCGRRCNTGRCSPGGVRAHGSPVVIPACGLRPRQLSPFSRTFFFVFGGGQCAK